jgi:hypothetical protein
VLHIDLDLDLDLDRMLVVRAPEAAERLLGLAGVAVTNDDQPARPGFSGASALLRSTTASRTVSSSALSASRICSAFDTVGPRAAKQLLDV